MTDGIIDVFSRDFLAQPFTFASDSRSPLFHRRHAPIGHDAYGAICCPIIGPSARQESCQPLPNLPSACRN